MAVHPSEQSDFHLKRVTQSHYRGGSSRVGIDIEDPFSEREIPKISISKKEDKVALKSVIVTQIDRVLLNVLPENRIEELKGSDYLDPIYKQIGI